MTGIRASCVQSSFTPPLTSIPGSLPLCFPTETPSRSFLEAFGCQTQFQWLVSVAEAERWAVVWVPQADARFPSPTVRRAPFTAVTSVCSVSSFHFPLCLYLLDHRGEDQVTQDEVTQPRSVRLTLN